MLNIVLNLTTAESEKHWSFVLSHFKPDNIYLVGDYETSDKIYQNAIKGLPEGELIIMTPLNARYVQGEIPLNDFVHPENANYYFGSDNQHMQEIEGVRVYVPTDDITEMYSWVAGAVTLWHRRYG